MGNVVGEKGFCAEISLPPLPLFSWPILGLFWPNELSRPCPSAGHSVSAVLAPFLLFSVQLLSVFSPFPPLSTSSCQLWHLSSPGRLELSRPFAPPSAVPCLAARGPFQPFSRELELFSQGYR